MNEWLIALGCLLLVWPVMALFAYLVTIVVALMLWLDDWAPLAGLVVLALGGTLCLLWGFAVI